ncbi:DUF2971 domain-containing protein [Azotosporobacter soli]|uniref:DUF2971 domain-containing protein n=1 Tax=Azotosporobacter soli TaxID=3055040 RepID=UPI0031FF1968
MSLFKYVSWNPFPIKQLCQHDNNKECELKPNCHSRENLLSSHLYFNSSKYFNDPFDLSPFCDVNATISQILEKAIETIMITESLKIKAATLKAKELIKLRKLHTKEGKEKAVADQLSLLQRIGVCCFSELKPDDHKSTLLWSHYAEKHSGLCLEFHLPSSLNVFTSIGARNPIFSPTPINYLPTLPQINLFINTQDDMLNCLTVKSPEWAYEKEHRAFSLNYVGLVQYEPWLLKTVTAGCNMNDTEFNELNATINKLSYQPQLFRARKKDREFGVELIQHI